MALVRYLEDGLLDPLSCLHRHLLSQSCDLDSGISGPASLDEAVGRPWENPSYGSHIGRSPFGTIQRVDLAMLPAGDSSPILPATQSYPQPYTPPARNNAQVSSG